MSLGRTCPWCGEHPTFKSGDRYRCQQDHWWILPGPPSPEGPQLDGDGEVSALELLDEIERLWVEEIEEAGGFIISDAMLGWPLPEGMTENGC